MKKHLICNLCCLLIFLKDIIKLDLPFYQYKQLHLQNKEILSLCLFSTPPFFFKMQMIHVFKKKSFPLNLQLMVMT